MAPTIASEALSASLGGAISAGILYPLEVLKTKMQADVSAANSNDDDDDDNNKDESSKKEQLSMIQYAHRLYKQQGLSVFVRGWEVSSFQSALEKALYFFAYTALKDLHCSLFLGNDQNAPLRTVPNLILGCLAEWAHLPITLPVDAWTTRIQTADHNNNNRRDTTTAAAAAAPEQSHTPLKILLAMLSEKDGCRHFYKGISAYYVLCLKPALQYTVYEQVKRILLRGRKNLSAAEAFLLGMVARTVATIIVFPVLRAKVLLQAQQKQQQQLAESMDGTNPKDNTTTNSTTTANTSKASDVVWDLYQRQGIAGLYQGLGPELTRGIFSAALMLMIKERLSDSCERLVSSSSSSKRHHAKR